MAAELIAIGYSDTVTARAAMEEIERLSPDFVIRADEIAAIVLDDNETFKTFINANIVRNEATWAMFWEMFFALLYFIPVLGMPVGTRFGEIVDKIQRSGIDPEFLDRARHMLTPGTSALFLIVEKVTPDRVVGALDEFGGTVLQSKLTKHAVNAVQEVLHGRHAVAV
jgi:uncharacterized membrane protein